MKPRLPLLRMALGIVLSMTAVGLMAQCTNVSQYPSSTIVADPLGAVTTISTCSFQEEYSVVGSVVSGATYQFTCTGNAYVTVHSGTSDGPVLGNGYSPLTVTTTSADNLYPHWNVDEQCNQASNCETTTVQLFLNCVPPSASVTTIDDCDNNQFSLQVVVTGLGDGTSVDLDYSVDGGAVQTMAGQGLGTYVIGPFTVGEHVDVTVAHSSDATCNVHFNNRTSGTCPVLIDCAGSGYVSTFCYHDSMDSTMVYQGNSTFPIALLFNAGQMESCCDNVTIYDGLTASGTPLYQGNNAGGSMAGILVVSTNPDHALTMVFHSDGSVNCGSSNYSQLDWIVSCLNCTQPEATFTVVTDCDNYEFSVDIEITSLGSDPLLDITNDGGAPAQTANAAGTYTVGPFTANIPVQITLVNDANNLCNTYSGELVNPLCPLIIDCGAPPALETYCYSNDDVHAWHWQAATPGDSLGIHFSSGTIQGNFGFPFGEQLRIYDGPDNTSPLLYEQIDFNTIDLAGLQFISSQPDIYMEMTSDGFGSCEDQSTTPWAWEVSCADCAPPAVTFSVVTDCDSMTYNVLVQIDTMGTDAVVDITNDNGAPSVSASAPGIYTVGPFPAASITNITLVNDVNSLCNLYSGSLTNPLCPTIINCGTDTLNEVYCYPDYDDQTWHWQSNGGQPLYMLFSAGTIESFFYDHLKIFDGPDELAPLLYENLEPFPGTDLAGLLIIASGPDLYMTFTSDGSGSCGGFGQSQWAWDVSCLDCTNPAATFSVVPDCLHHTYQVAVNVSSTGSDPTVRIANSYYPDTLLNVGVGTTLSAPIPMDSMAVITVLNESNDLCRIFSPAFNSPSTDCDIPSCEITNYDYCYTNSDTAWYTYVGTSATEPLTIDFVYGQLLANDYVEIFDGPNTQSPLLYIGNNGGNMAGVSFNSTNPEHTITLRIVSDGSYSCATGQTASHLNWDVLCGYVGINEATTTSFVMFPNPTTGKVDMVLPSSVKGAVDVRVLDISGRTVHHEMLTVNSAGNMLDLRDLQNGNYTVVITTADNTGAQKLQIVH